MQLNLQNLDMELFRDVANISNDLYLNKISVYPLLTCNILYQYAIRVNILDKRFQCLFDIANA